MHTAARFCAWMIVIYGAIGCRSEGNRDDAPADGESTDDATTVDATTAGSSDGADTTTASTGDMPSTCDLFTNDCPDGTKCMAVAEVDGGPWTATACMPLVDDPVGVGEPCTVQDSPTSGLDDCEAQAVCWYVDPALAGGRVRRDVHERWSRPGLRLGLRHAVHNRIRARAAAVSRALRSARAGLPRRSVVRGCGHPLRLRA